VPAAGQTELSLILRSTADSPEGSYSFVIGADTDTGLSSSVGGELVLAGRPQPLPARGVAVKLTPARPVAGPGTTVTCVARFVNTGDVVESLAFAVEPPEGVRWSGEPVLLDVVPGLENYRDLLVTLAPESDIVPGDKPFSVVANSADGSGIETVANGILEVLPRGVTLSVTPQRAPLGTPLTLSVANPGSTAEVYDLSLGGELGPVAQLGQTTVVLEAHATASVEVTFMGSAFALPGDLPLWIGASVRGEERLRGQALATLEVPETVGLEAWFHPESSEWPGPGSSSATLFVRNRGNAEEVLSVAILETTGPILAGLRLPDDQVTNTIAVVRLPRLGTAAFILEATLTAAGPGTVTVGVTSSRHPDLTTQATAFFQTSAGFTLRRTDGIELEFEPLPGLSHELEYRGSLDPAGHWFDLPGGPHDTGYYLDRDRSFMRFYRVRLSGAGDLPVSIRVAAETELTWTPAPGTLYTVQFLDALAPGAVWRDLPEAPHPGGRVIDPTGRPYRFYRLMMTPAE